MEYNIGEKIKNLRKYLRLTQEELSQNICSQSMISKIEKNEEIHISAHLLHRLSQRLGVSIDYFFSDSEIPNINYVNEVCEQIRAFILAKKYEEAYKVVKFEKKNPVFQNKQHLKRYLLWREAICITYLEASEHKALILLDKALSLSETSLKNYSIEELDILTSKAIILGNLNKRELAAQLYEKVLYHTLNAPSQKDKTTLINLYYNYCRELFFLHDYQKALNLCESGIRVSISENNYIVLGYLYYQKAQILFKINKAFSEDVINHYEKALWIFDKAENIQNIKYIKRKLKRIKQLNTF